MLINWKGSRYSSLVMIYCRYLSAFFLNVFHSIKAVIVKKNVSKKLKHK